MVQTMTISGELNGKVALVTGGSNGIGAAVVRSLAGAGAQVAIGYHSSRERAEKVAGELPGSGHSIVHLSLEDVPSIKAAASELASKISRLDILVNSAGFTSPVPHHDLTALDDDLFGSILMANARGPYSIIRALMPLLKASDDAVVVSVSSISAPLLVPAAISPTALQKQLLTP